MFRNAVLVLLVLMLVTFQYSVGQAGKINLEKQWLDKPGMSEIVLGKAEIEEYNYLIRQLQTGDMPDLAEYPEQLDKEELTRYINLLELPPGDIYSQGKIVTAAQKANLQLARNIDNMSELQKVEYAVTVRRSNLRTFPTDMPIYESIEDTEFDLFQETVLDPSEAVVVLWKSADKQFAFVQSKNYRGWVSILDLAFVKQRNIWLKYVKPEKFLIVTDKLINLQNQKETLLWQMGSKILLTKKLGKTNFEIIVPERDNQGNLKEQRKKVRLTGVNEGYLAYTRANIIRQAFKMLDDPYGWGGLHNSVDCSSFIENIYRSVGIQLPRNADQQETASANIICLNTYSSVAKKEVIRQLPPATVLFKDGHTMLYLGEQAGRLYVIHALGSQGMYNLQNEIVRKPIMKVVVTDLDILMRSGKLMLDTLHTAVDYR